jgi:hypothetical protein
VPPPIVLTTRRNLSLLVASFVQPVGADAWKKRVLVASFQPLSFRCWSLVASTSSLARKTGSR